MKGKESFVCKMKKFLYGLKQASRAWYKKISEYFIDIGFFKCFFEFNLYVLNFRKDMFLILLLLILIVHLLVVDELSESRLDF